MWSPFRVALFAAPSGGGPSPITGTISVTQAADTMAASGTVTIPAIAGTIATTEAADTATGSGTVTAPSVTGTLARTEAADTMAASGIVAGPGAITGSIAVTEQADTASGSGTVTGPPAVTGTLARAEAADTMSAAGIVAGPGAITGSIDRAEAADTMSAVGTVAGPSAVTGSASITEAADTASGSGTVVYSVTGTIAVTEAPDTMSSLTTLVYGRINRYTEPRTIVVREGQRMTASSTTSYRTIDEDPGIAYEWRDRDGALIDLSTATFGVTLTNLATAATVTKTTGVLGDDASPNVVITWAPGELAALGAGTWAYQLTATIGGRERTLRPGSRELVIVRA